MRVIMAAAGTGGHINPAIAIANKIKKEEPDSEIIFIGAYVGLEKDLVPRAGYELKQIESHGIVRKPTFSNLKNFHKTINTSVVQAKKIIKEFKPDLIIGTGGYVCVSVGIAATVMKVPFIIHESNVLPGVATKMLAKKAKKILVGFKEAKEKLPRGTKVIVTGTPTKVEKVELTEKEVKEKKKELGFDPDMPLAIVFGGSQGAKSINITMEDIIKEKINKTYQLMWAVGPDQYKIVKEDLKKENIDIEHLERIQAVPYIYNMSEVLNVSDLAIVRSGAMTITELEKIGTPAIFIPFPYAAENHQEYNARALEDEGAAKVILDKDLNSEILDKTILEILSNEDTLKSMSKNIAKLSIKNPEDLIYKELKVD